MSASDLSAIRATMRAHLYADEPEAVTRLAATAALDEAQRAAISSRAAGLVRAVRTAAAPTMMESFLAEYGLSTGEGVALMCLAEALLRVPDASTMDELIRDKITPHDWASHSGSSSSVMVNASTWALMLTGRVLDDEEERGIEGTLHAMVRRLGEPVIRRAVGAAMREMGEQFVLGRTIDEAVKRGREMTAKGYLYSYDMLGEAARTHEDAERYFNAYAKAIAALARSSNDSDIRRNPGISVKLSALHPRYEVAKRHTMVPQMADRLLKLAQAAKDGRMGLNIDAEEVDRLDLSLDVIEAVLADPSLAGWDGFGVVVQAYGPRAPFVLDWLHELAEKLDRRIMVRLVKGAYWDSEIKRAQVMGLPGYPVFTRKVHTDLSYLACARKLLSMTDRIYPQFATHNAHTAAAILAMAPDRDCFEFQRLHGMGEALHEAVRVEESTRCRIYAPVGQHSDLLAYLVRRLLENGANSSFVHQIVDEEVAPEEIARDPVAAALAEDGQPNPAIRRPADIFQPVRANSRGRDFTDPVDLTALDAERAPFAAPYRWQAAPVISGKAVAGKAADILNPANPDEIVGSVIEAGEADVHAAMEAALAAQPDWEALGAQARADRLSAAAMLFEAHSEELYMLCAREAGKTVADAIAEVREAVDFLHYYAAEAGKASAGTQARGVIGCISPWNFPLAIFTGQVAAALATGNAVIAKPAEQTPLIAARAVALLHEAGVPGEVLHLVPGDGQVGGLLTSQPGISGICFTGSTEVARIIERQLAKTAAPDAMLIAETGGLNAMIVDSTALPEQAVRDAVASAFQSAGQRCSALRVLYVQEDVADKVTEMLTGAMEALEVGDPLNLATDVGPVIDADALTSITAWCATAESEGRLVAKLAAPSGGRFVAPHVLRVKGIGDMEREIFGPVLHLATFRAQDLEKVIADINGRGYGLTFGLHTRIDDRVQDVIDRIHAGNVYVNRNQIGAIVASQPFGGEGLSGTGPKAGGPHYLRRFRKSVEASASPSESLPASGEAIRRPEKAATAQWAGRSDRVSHLRKLLRGRAADAVSAAAALDMGPADLSGPTGEANTLSLVPRGHAVILGGDPQGVLAMAVQALAAGNAVSAFGPGAAEVLKPLTGQGLPLTVSDSLPGADTLQESAFDVAGAMGDAAFLGALRAALAARAGSIVPLVTERLYPAAWCHERSVCVDTTAAGGNASLLAAAG
ncbi:MAG: bifunctional proline dehydrogenase/L-glutamate gamma-semialdehyde dehydrogenase PutA [Notoacmeibacter sp.]|nr:bifunctional proline dehydrogenase/L-glutamate gamma-semialdehyde dehydrogenase PutA [Notoacmeibacter sp.]